MPGFSAIRPDTKTIHILAEREMGSALRASSLRDRRRCADVSLPLLNPTITFRSYNSLPALYGSYPLAEREGFEPSMGF